MRSICSPIFSLFSRQLASTCRDLAHSLGSHGAERVIVSTLTGFLKGVVGRLFQLYGSCINWLRVNRIASLFAVLFGQCNIPSAATRPFQGSVEKCKLSLQHHFGSIFAFMSSTCSGCSTINLDAGINGPPGLPASHSSGWKIVSAVWFMHQLAAGKPHRLLICGAVWPVQYTICSNTTLSGQRGKVQAFVAASCWKHLCIHEFNIYILYIYR